MTDSDSKILSEIMRLHSEIASIFKFTGNKENVRSITYRQSIKYLKNHLKL